MLYIKLLMVYLAIVKLVMLFQAILILKYLKRRLVSIETGIYGCNLITK